MRVTVPPGRWSPRRRRGRPRRRWRRRPIADPGRGARDQRVQPGDAVVAGVRGPDRARADREAAAARNRSSRRLRARRPRASSATTRVAAAGDPDRVAEHGDVGRERAIRSADRRRPAVVAQQEHQRGRRPASSGRARGRARDAPPRRARRGVPRRGGTALTRVDLPRARESGSPGRGGKSRRASSSGSPDAPRWWARCSRFAQSYWPFQPAKRALRARLQLGQALLDDRSTGASPRRSRRRSRPGGRRVEDRAAGGLREPRARVEPQRRGGDPRGKREQARPGRARRRP